MKWFSVAKYAPEVDTYYIARMRSDFNNSGDVQYKGIWFDHYKEWMYDSDDIDDCWKVTHFALPDPVEIES